MAMVLQQTIHGFDIVKITNIEEVKGTGYEMIHKKSGAKLYYLATEDDNKVFSVTFRTPPYDSTGLPHILEHSVLCGSEKYPLKDPFVELAKGSLNTFLNAMTFSDKTMYPIASRNDQDFMNLMDVYMNAVFYPNLLQQDNILKQEGWHYALENPGDPLEIKGVVYNEMKGAFSSPEQILFRKIQETLFPHTPYGYESGGDPDIIPALTQEKFTQFHGLYYHPSNAYIYLYGNGNIEEHLSFINEQYLCHFNAIQVDSSIPLEKAFLEPLEISIPYPIGPDEHVQEKTYVSLNYVTGVTTDPEQQLAMEMLNYLLLGTSAAPLKRALLKANLGKDVFGSFDSSLRQPVFSIVIKNSDESAKEAFMEVVESTLNTLVEKGIDKKLVEAVINIHEFKLREGDFGRYPKGLIYGMKMMESWLYEEDPSLHLRYEKTLLNIKAALTAPYFEHLIQQMLLDNPHRSLLMVVPEKGLNEHREKELTKELEERKAAMSVEELTQLIEENKQLQFWQNTPHTEEELSTIPLLSIDDLDENPEPIPNEVEEMDGCRVLKHLLFTNQIQYTSLYFDASHIKEEEVFYAGLLVRLLGRLNTRSYTYDELSNEMNLHTGGIYASTDVISLHNQNENNRYLLTVKGKSLTTKNAAFWHLMDEIVTGTQWDDLARIREVVREIKSRLEMSFHQEGHMVAARRVLASFSPGAAFKEQVGGISFYHFISQLDHDFDNRIEDTLHHVKVVLEKMIVKSNVVASYTGEEKDYPRYKTELKAFIDQLKPTHTHGPSTSFAPMALGNEGLVLSGKVNYVAKASNFMTHGYAYSGSMQVLRTIASLDYLWKRIRVSGGAYGAMAGLVRSGSGYFVSYRDPNIRQTLTVYDEMAGFLQAFQASDREMTKYIIGTMSRVDAPLTPSMKGDKADVQFLSGYTYEEEKKERLEIIHTSAADIRGFSEMIGMMMKDNLFVVVGNETDIKESSDLFDAILHIQQ